MTLLDALILWLKELGHKEAQCLFKLGPLILNLRVSHCATLSPGGKGGWEVQDLGVYSLEVELGPLASNI